jgi:hypothetical protein
MEEEDINSTSLPSLIDFDAESDEKIATVTFS